MGMTGTTRQLRRILLGGWLLSALFLAGGIGLLAWHFSAAALAQQYRSAPACPPRDTVLLPHGIELPLSPRDPNCVSREQARVDDRNRDFARSGTRYELLLSSGGGDQQSVTLAGSNSQALWDAATPGSQVTVLFWHDGVTEVDLSPSLRAATDTNPDVESSFSLVYGVICVAIAGFVLLSQLALRRRRVAAAAPGAPLDGPAPGAIGAPSIFSAEAPRTYRSVPSWWSALARLLALDAVVALAALRFDSGGTVAVVAALAATPLGALYVWWFSGFTLVVAETTVTFRNHRGQVTVPWSNARLKARHGSMMLVLDTPERSRRISLRTFTMYNRSNAGLVRDLLQHIGRAVRTAPAPASAATRPPVTGNRLRLATWAIDLVPVFGVWVVLLLVASLTGSIVGRPVSSSTMNVVSFPAGYLGAVLYLLVCWRLGGTVGTRLLRLRLVDARTGARPSWAQVGRRLLVALPSIALIVPFGLLVDAQPPWHDQFARTALVRRAAVAELRSTA